MGNANELAYDYEANNYKYDEISVKFIGCFDNSNMVDTIMLDTISKFIPYDENASFYSGIRQMYYFTDRKLQLGKEYQLVIFKTFRQHGIVGENQDDQCGEHFETVFK